MTDTQQANVCSRQSKIVHSERTVERKRTKNSEVLILRIFLYEVLLHRNTVKYVNLLERCDRIKRVSVKAIYLPLHKLATAIQYWCSDVKTQNGYQQGRQDTYSAILRCVRVTIVAVKNQ